MIDLRELLLSQWPRHLSDPLYEASPGHARRLHHCATPVAKEITPPKSCMVKGLGWHVARQSGAAFCGCRTSRCGPRSAVVEAGVGLGRVPLASDVGQLTERPRYQMVKRDPKKAMRSHEPLYRSLIQ